MKGRALLASLAAAAGCSPPGTDGEGVAWTVADLAGRYRGSGRVLHLELCVDGTYEGWVFNGVTADGCGTVVGAGTSAGSWALEGEVVTFTPTAEPPDLVVTFADASARPSAQSLRLKPEGTVPLLVRKVAEARPTDPSKHAEGAADRR